MTSLVCSPSPAACVLTPHGGVDNRHAATTQRSETDPPHDAVRGRAHPGVLGRDRAPSRWRPSLGAGQVHRKPSRAAAQGAWASVPAPEDSASDQDGENSHL